jgi:hypothetical protein
LASSCSSCLSGLQERFILNIIWFRLNIRSLKEG